MAAFGFMVMPLPAQSVSLSTPRNQPHKVRLPPTIAYEPPSVDRMRHSSRSALPPRSSAPVSRRERRMPPSARSAASGDLPTTGARTIPRSKHDAAHANRDRRSRRPGKPEARAASPRPSANTRRSGATAPMAATPVTRRSCQRDDRDSWSPGGLKAEHREHRGARDSARPCGARPACRGVGRSRPARGPLGCRREGRRRLARCQHGRELGEVRGLNWPPGGLERGVW